MISCKICGFEKDDDNFKRTKNGRRRQCTECLNKKKADHYSKNKNTILNKMKKHRETHGEEIKKRKQKYREENKEKIGMRGRRHYANNKKVCLKRSAEYRMSKKAEIKKQRMDYRSKPGVKEAEKERKRKWAMKNPEMLKLRIFRRRAMKRSATIHPVTVSDLRKKAEKFNWLCYYCKSRKYECWDHAVPLIRGGSHSIDNLVPACNTCNLKKGTKTEEEFMTQVLA
jgi:5-methylcytosine-specific restriction endonuclease McrA